MKRVTGRPSLLLIEARYGKDDKDAPYSDRYSIILNNERLWLQPSVFKYLALLAWARVAYAECEADKGWIHKEDMDPSDPNIIRYLHRLRTTLALDANTSWRVFENNRRGMYRLDLDSRSIRFNVANLRRVADHAVSKRFESEEVTHA